MNTLRKCMLTISKTSFSSPRNTTKCIQLYGNCFSTTVNLSNPRSHTVKKLQELFNIRESTASNIIHDHKIFLTASVDEIDKTYRTCLDAGIAKKNLLCYVDVLTISYISDKIELLKKLPYDLNITVPLLVLDEKLLKTFVVQEISEKRIKHLGKLFNIKTVEVCELLSKRPFLISLDLIHIRKCFSLLSRYQVPKEDILKDLWIFKYAVMNIENKLQFAQENNIQTIKTWMIRVPTPTLENYIRRRSDNQSILGPNSVIEYLSQKLQCSQELAKYIISKHPAIQKKNLRKINGMIDFLLSKGFTTVHICRTPKILLHSVDTIRERLNLLDAQGTQLNSLSVCTKSKKQFTQFLESISSDKNKKTATC